MCQGRRLGLGGALDCFCSEGLRLLQWLGPLDTLQVRPRLQRGGGAGRRPGGPWGVPCVCQHGVSAWGVRM